MFRVQYAGKAEEFEPEPLPLEERRARHEEQHSRMKQRDSVEEVNAADRRLLHGAVLAEHQEGLNGDGPESAQVAPESDDRMPGEGEYRAGFFSKKLRRSTPSSREALLRLLASSKKKGRVVFDFGFRNIWDDMYSAITLKRPIKPTSRLRTTWDAIILSLICYGLFMIPFDIAFNVSVYPWLIFDVALDIFYIMDVGMNFLTAYVSDDNEMVMDFRKIRNHYLRTWFFLDLVASLPFGIISYALAQGSEAFQVLKLLKAFRLFRMSHLYRALAWMNNLKGPFMVFIIMIMFGIAAHWFACLFWKIGLMQGVENSWIALQTKIPNLIGRDQSEQYIVCLYWALATIATLGYGDLTPVTTVEITYATLVIFSGASMYAILISSLSMVVVGRFAAESEYNRHMDSLQAFAKLYMLPPDVTRRLVAYYDFIWERRKNFSNQTIMDDLPLELKAVVAGAVHAKMIDHNPLLSACDSFGFKHMFAAKISQIVLRLPDEVLHFEGDPVTEVFFVRRGLVDVVVGLDTPDELVVGKRKDGGHCGDIGLFNGGYYAASGVTVHFSEVCSITAKALLHLLEQFPRERELFETVAKARSAAVERLLTEFDELAAGRQNSVDSPRAGPDGLSRQLDASRKQAGTFILRLLGHQADDTDVEFFWKLWETAVSPESDEVLVEQTVRTHVVLEEQQEMDNSGLKSSASFEAEKGPGSPRLVETNPFDMLGQAAQPSLLASNGGLSERQNARRLKAYVSDAQLSGSNGALSARRGSGELSNVGSTVLNALGNNSPNAGRPASPRNFRIREESPSNVLIEPSPSVRAGRSDSIAREFDALTLGEKRASTGTETVRGLAESLQRSITGASPVDTFQASTQQLRFQEAVLARLNVIMNRLEVLEVSERRRRRSVDEANESGPSARTNSLI